MLFFSFLINKLRSEIGKIIKKVKRKLSNPQKAQNLAKIFFIVFKIIEMY
jgi:hypothetical protein